MKKEKIYNILKKLSQSKLFYAIINAVNKIFYRKDTSDMGCESINLLKQIYGATDIPVAVADVTDEKLNILWRNAAAEKLELFEDNSACFISCKEELRDGTLSVSVNGVSHMLNVIKYCSDGCLYIIEYLGRDSSQYISAMKNYFTALCTRLRESAGQLAMSADDINMIIKGGGSDVASSLNRIDRNIMMLLNETILPEQIYYALDPNCKNEIVSLEQEVAFAAADAEKALGRASEVWQNEIEGITVCINRSILETILACMTAESCCDELFPDKVEFVVERISDKRASVSVRSINLSGNKNRISKLDIFKQPSEFPGELFRQLLAEKYGAAFEKKIHPDGIESIMILNVLPEQNRIVKSGSKYALREERFSTMAVSLSEKHHGERYNNIKMN